MEMRSRGVEPDVGILRKLTLLSKISKDNITYLSQLAESLLVPVMGQDLSDIALNLDAVRPLVLEKVEETIRLNKAMTFIQSLEKLNEAIQFIKLPNKTYWKTLITEFNKSREGNQTRPLSPKEI